MRQGKCWAIAAIVLFGAACGSTPTAETSRYLLRGPVVGGVAHTGDAPRLGVTAVQIPSYLQDDGIVVELADHEIRHARHHRWAEPLEHGLRHALISALEAELGQSVELGPGQARWDERVMVYVEQMHGAVDGDFVFHVGWRVFAEASQSERVGRIAVTERLPASGYAALVDMHMAKIGELATAIASDVKALRDAI